MEGGAAFSLVSVVERYLLRPPYPAALFQRLTALLPRGESRVLDLGCGPGKLTLGLAPHVDRIDAVDPSEAMLELARRRAADAAPQAAIRWHGCRAEELTPEEPGYDLVTTGASIHWMDQDQVLPRIGEWLAPHGWLAVVDGDAASGEFPWKGPERALLGRYIERLTGKVPDWANHPTSPEVVERRLLTHPRFARAGEEVFRAPFSQSVRDYVACFHSRQTFCLERMGPELARAFDEELTSILTPHADPTGRLSFEVATRLEWGRVAP